MSLADHLADELATKPKDCVICTWVATLSAEDQATYHQFRRSVEAGNGFISQLWRACTKSGLDVKYKRFGEHHRNHCDVTG